MPHVQPAGLGSIVATTTGVVFAAMGEQPGALLGPAHGPPVLRAEPAVVAAAGPFGIEPVGESRSSHRISYLFEPLLMPDVLADAPGPGQLCPGLLALLPASVVDGQCRGETHGQLLVED